MNELKDWKCEGCGWCCRNLPNGLLLWHDEYKLFDADATIPFIGIGRAKHIQPATFIMTKPCQHLKDDGCQIQKIKPIACKLYPFNIPMGSPKMVLAECQGETITKLRTSGQPINSKIPKHIEQTLREYQQMFQEIIKRKLWRWDPKANRWRKIKK